MMMFLKPVILFMIIYEVCGQSLYLPKHNELRKLENANLPDMTWDPALAQVSAALAAKCVFEHSVQNEVGENLAQSTSSAPIDETTEVPNLIARWVNDEKQFNDGTWSCCGNTNSACCHYTQVVWKTTTKVGCGHAQCGTKIDGSSAHSILVVCQYSPKGNMANTPPY